MFADRSIVESSAREGRLLDVRSAVEFTACHIPGATNIPLDQLELHASKVADIKGRLVLTCHSGKRAEKARQLLLSCGRIDALLVVEGGTEGWRVAGHPVNLGRPSMSLERQVRVVAGSLAAAGAAAALLVNPIWAMLPLLVGSGLTIAGLTDSCLMGDLLMRMPWNRSELADGETTIRRLEESCSASA